MFVFVLEVIYNFNYKKNQIKYIYVSYMRQRMFTLSGAPIPTSRMDSSNFWIYAHWSINC